MSRRKSKLSSRKNQQTRSHRLRALIRKKWRQKINGIIEIPENVTNGNFNFEQNGFRGFNVPPLKPSICVLSLFDGMSSALHVLDKLKLHVRVYYSSEVDSKALQLQRHRFADRITQIGSVLDADEATLESLAPISLLIGGSSCTDLFPVNPRQHGLKDHVSNGKLLEYVRIKNYLSSRASADHTPFFWLFESTGGHMEVDTHHEISRILGCSPIIKKVSNYLPVHQRRLYWHNIPQPNRASTTVPHPIRLDDILPPSRTPTVSLIPTLTTMSTSQRNGKAKILPVLEDGIPSSLYITEIEALFGFPESYTDGPNLTFTDRRKLLEKSFCLPVIQEILSPLTKLFWVLP